MRPRTLKLGMLTLAFIFSSLVGFSSLASARDGADDATQPPASEQEQQNERLPRTGTLAENHSGPKLSGDKLNSCRVHERVINQHMKRIAARGARHLSVFQRITARVENFAETQKKPSNYDALVADLNVKKAAAVATVEKIQTDSVSFKCDGTDPKGVADGFKADLKAEIDALKTYKTALKNLTTAVKSANSDSDAGTTGGSQQ
jgi:hypothetical protein